MRRLILLTVLALGPTAARAENGLVYLGAGLTDSSLSEVILNNPPTDLRSYSWKAFAGVRPLKWLAVEADYIDLGSGSSTIMENFLSSTTHADGSAWAGYAVGFIPLGVVDL